jgi:hypothetical protein
MNVERFCKVNLVAAAVLGLCWNVEAALTRYAILGYRQPLGTEVKFSVAGNWNGTMLPVSDPDNTIVRTFGHGRTLLNDLPEDFCLCGIEFTQGCSSSVIRGNPFNIHSGGLSCDAQSASVSTQRFENALNFFTAAVGMKTSGANDCLFFAGRVNHLAESFGDRRFDFGGKGTIVIAGGISVLAQAGDDLQSCWEKTSQINGGVLVVA